MSWSAQIYVKWKPEVRKDWENWDWLKDWPKVQAAWSTMGEWDAVLWVDAATPEEVEKFVFEHLRSNDWVQDTKTHWWNQVWQKSA